MSKITAFAKGRDCTARIPGICNDNPETVVWCHLNSIRWGAGRGHKSPDACGLIACSACHDAIDGRGSSAEKYNLAMTRDYIDLCAYGGHMESLALLIQKGILK